MTYRLYKITYLPTNEIYIGITKHSIIWRFSYHVINAYRKGITCPLGDLIKKHDGDIDIFNYFRLEELGIYQTEHAARVKETELIHKLQPALNVQGVNGKKTERYRTSQVALNKGKILCLNCGEPIDPGMFNRRKFCTQACQKAYWRRTRTKVY